MTISDLGSIGEFVASIGVVITLIFLASQVRQNTKALKVSSYQEFVSRQIQVNDLTANHAETFVKTQSGEEFSASDEIIHMARLSSTIRNGDALYYQYQQGLIDEKRVDSALMAIAGSIADDQLGLDIWALVQNRYDDEYCKAINIILDTKFEQADA